MPGGVTTAEANDAWRRCGFRPQVLRGVGEADLATTLLGTSVTSPIAVAPTAMQRAVHAGGERAMAEGVAEAGPHVVSSNSGTRSADLGAAGPWWLQAYLPPDRDLLPSGGRGAVAAGAAPSR